MKIECLGCFDCPVGDFSHPSEGASALQFRELSKSAGFNPKDFSTDYAKACHRYVAERQLRIDVSDQTLAGELLCGVPLSTGIAIPIEEQDELILNPL